MEPVPTTVDNDGGPIPELAGVAHAWLGQLDLVDFGLKPKVFFSVEDEDIIDNSLFPIAFSPPEHH